MGSCGEAHKTTVPVSAIGQRVLMIAMIGKETLDSLLYP